MAQPPNDGLEKVLDELVKQVKSLAEKVGVLGTNQKEVLETTKRKATDRKALFQTIRGMNPGMSEEEVNSLVDMQIRRVDQGGYGISGMYNRLTTAQFPSGEEAVALLGYGQTFQRGRLARAYGLGALIQQSFAPRSAGSISFSAAYKGGLGGGTEVSGLSGLTPEEYNAVIGVTRRGPKGTATETRDLNPELEAALRSLDVSGDKSHADAYKRLFGKPDELAKSAKGVESARSILMDALFQQEGSSLQMLAQSDNPLIRSAAARMASAASTGGFAGTAFRFGGQLMAGARALAGPIGTAITAGQAAYSAINTLYDPARSAAGLGYGFSMNPLSEGARVSMGRSLQTRLSSLSFGLSGQQAAAARGAVEGMGLGGPGQETAYNQYYRSMTDVMENTQLDAAVLNPFYEQFMRQGTGSDEVSRLTKMLRDDLPKAAAASRMSLEGMAQMIQRTTQAVAGNPFASAGRTEAEISQTLMTAAQSGGPPGMQGIAGGMNSLVVAQTASRLGTGYFTAAQQAGQLQATTTDILRQFLGDMSPDQFEAYRKTEQGAIQIMTVGAMTGLSNTDIQKIYDIGLDDYAASSVLGETFSDSNLGDAKTKKELGMVPDTPTGSRFGGYGAAMIGKQIGSQKIRGTNFDLYKKSGSDLKGMYGEDIKAMENALKNMGGTELEDFQSKLTELQDDKAIETWKLLQDTSKKISGGATKDDKLEGLIDLSEEAKRYFKLEFSSGSPRDYPPNSDTNIGGTRVG